MIFDAIKEIRQHNLPFDGIYVFSWFDEARSGLVFNKRHRLGFWFSHIATLDSEDDWQHIYLLCRIVYEPFERLNIVSEFTQGPPNCNQFHIQVLINLLQNDLNAGEGFLTMSSNIRIELGNPVAFSEMTPIEQTLYLAQLKLDIDRLQVDLKACLERVHE